MMISVTYNIYNKVKVIQSKPSPSIIESTKL